MNLKKCHIDYYRARKVPHAAWFGAVKGYAPDNMPSIDQLINAHAELKPNDADMVAQNTLMILRSARKRAGQHEMVRWMESMYIHPGTVVNPKRRAAYCRKWLHKMGRVPDELA